VTPERFRTLVSGILIVGVSVSASLMLLGFATSLLVGWEGSLTGAPPGTSGITDFTTMGESLLALRPVGIAQLGLLVLIATPVVRVAASVVAFVLEDDRLYAGITFAVLVILLLSLFGLR
jgi:uncharacterized membrane protein